MNNTMPALSKQEGKFNKQNKRPILSKLQAYCGQGNLFSSSKNPQLLQSSIQNNSTDCTFLFSHSENVKLQQTIGYRKQRQIQFQHHQQQSYANLEQQLVRLENNINKCSESSCSKIQEMIEQLQLLNTSVNSQEQKEKAQTNQILMDHYTSLQTNKITPAFGDIRQMNHKTMREYREEWEKLEQRLQQNIEKPKKQQQKQRASDLLEALNNSIHVTQYIQAQMQEMNKWSEERLGSMEDRVSQLQLEIERCVDKSSELRRRQDKLMEQLVEKVIYKMTYL